MKAVIIVYGEMLYRNEILSETETANYIICADGGGVLAYENGIIPNFLIGDFDSISQEALNFFEANGVNIMRYPRDKDFTDTELCVNKALELGCDEICILAGIGTRIDHSLGNLGLLHLISKKGARGFIKSKNSCIYLCKDSIVLKGNIGDTVSIIPFYCDVYGLRTIGLKFELDNYDMEFGRSIGISNEMTRNCCTVEVSKGEILVIKQNII